MRGMDDYLHVDVWNYILDESPKQKLRKISKVKDPKGLKQFVFDLTNNKSNNGYGSEMNCNHKLIGSIEIPLSDIPAAGLDKWWNLEKLDSKVSLSKNYCIRVIYLLLLYVCRFDPSNFTITSIASIFIYNLSNTIDILLNEQYGTLKCV